jgi:1-acyl-sn-glycerol-3-phosphate acyltransferase
VLLSIISSILFAIGTIILSVLSIPAALIDRSGKTYLWVSRKWARSFLLLFGIRVRITGASNIKKGEHYVYVANHSSYTDIPLLLATVPDNIRLILRNSLTRIPIWGWALLVSPFLIIDRSSAVKSQRTLGKAIGKIRKGASVILFPEGTRTSTGDLQAFKRGAFHLAYDSGAPVLPVAIIGSYQIMSRHDKLPKWGQRAEIRIGEAIYPKQVPKEQARAAEIELMKEAETRVRVLLVNTTTTS